MKRLVSLQGSVCAVALLLAAVFFHFDFAGSSAQTTPEGVKPPEQKEPIPPEPRKEKELRQPLQPSSRGGPVSFYFDDADIFEVIQTVFGEILKANYIIDQRVKGKVTFRSTTPVPRDEVLPIMDTILRMNGIGFVEERGIYKIVPLTDVPDEIVYSQVGKDPEKVFIEIFTLKNINIRESIAEIGKLMNVTTKGGSIRIVPMNRLNAIMVIVSTKEQLGYVRKWVETFDAMFLNARPKIFVYPLQNSKATHVASLLQSILGGSAAPSPSPAPATRTEPTRAPGAATSVSPTAPAAAAAPRTGAAVTASGSGFLVSAETKIFADDINNSLIILATPSDYSFIEETVKKIDVLPRQVMIEAYLLAIDLSDNLNFGFSWSLVTDLNFSLKPFTRDFNLSGEMFQQPPKLDKTVSDEGFTFIATDPSGIVRAKLIAALKDSKARVLAAPHVLVSDNREARIQVGSQVPIATSQTSSPIGTGEGITSTTTSTIQYKDIGIIMKVKPQINDSGLISLELSQEVSSLGERLLVAGVINQAINKTEATTNLVAQNGETIIIGGLIREDDTTGKTGIPLLSQIPVIGHLFSNQTRETRRTELMMLLTPHVTRNMTDAKNLTLDYIERYNRTARDKRIEDFIKERTEGEQSTPLPPKAPAESPQSKGKEQ